MNSRQWLDQEQMAVSTTLLAAMPHGRTLKTRGACAHEGYSLSFFFSTL